MKRLLALAALLLAASACTTTTDNTNTGAGNANANANANVAASPAPAGPTQADIEAKERQAYDAIKAKNWDALAAMLTDDFIIVSKEGVEAKAPMLESMKKYDLAEYTLSDFRLIKVDADLAVITYTETEKSTTDGKANPSKPTRGSTAWVNRGGKWLAAYHQETEIVSPPPGQDGNANANAPGASNTNASNTNAATAASPASSPAAAPASATDAEKAVWDAIKSKNSDAFANFLAPEAYEVEGEGVYDKSASIKGVMMFDASKFTLSDFRELRLDADATLVTYKATGPMGGKTVTEQHTTIWNNRGGQWKAYFHQGTPLSK